MNLLLDTNAVLHLTLAPQNLSLSARAAIVDPDNAIFVSAITGGELACLEMKRRISLPESWHPWFRAKISNYGWRVLPITLEIFAAAYTLPGDFHNDPCDRVIVATARLASLTVVSSDKLILDYPHVQSVS